MHALRASDPANAMPDLARIASATVNAQVVAFLLTLTDPCVADRACIRRWVPAAIEAPDAHQLQGIDRSGNPL